MSASWQEKTVFAFLFALLTAAAAQARFLLPFTPVPLTGQVLMVLLGAVVLGRYGALAQAMYLGMGAGLGWFSGLIGAAAFAGVTGGYLVGFLLASAFLGELVERRSAWSAVSIAAALSASSLLILLSGSLWLMPVLGIGLPQALALGTLPFLAVEAVKVSAACVAARVFLPARGG
jgi:biotin transport system substrate-specific component